MSQIDLTPVLGLGIAGNFVGYLQQAGEESDYANIPVKEKNAPKGVFSFYLPTPEAAPFNVFPFSEDRVSRPSPTSHLHAEPEVGLLCNLTYNDVQQVISVTPTHFTATNDCSVRMRDKTKLRDKKNWGAASHGCAGKWIAIDRFSKGGIMDNYRLCCYLKRGESLNAYGVDSPVLGYSYFYEQLLEWLVEKLNTQADAGPLESMPEVLKLAKYPEQAFISIGATRYTHFGESTFLESGDEIIVAVYDGTQYRTKDLEDLFSAGTFLGEKLAVLRQVVD